MTLSKQEFLQISEINVTYKSQIPENKRPKISNSSDAEQIFRSVWEDDIELWESFYLMMLNRRNAVKGVKRIAVGGISGVVADVKIILGISLKTLSCGIVVAHNHPSGNIHPSEADKKLTDKLKQGCKLLDLSFLDHVILTATDYYSFADHGLL